MSYCSKCGQELNGRYCSGCGHDNQKKKNEKVSKALDWIKEKAKAVWSFIARHKKPIIISATAFVTVLTTVIVLVSVLTNIYRVGKVSKIELGMQTSEVEKILGEPSEKDDYAWYYYEKKVEKKFDKTNELFEKMMNADSEKEAEKFYDKLSDVYEDIEKMTYKFIMVKFNGKGEVTEVFLDKNHKYNELDDYATEEKTVKKLELDKDSIEAIEMVDAEGKHLTYDIVYASRYITYSVQFSDGSFFRKAQTVSVSIDENGTTATLEWEDDIDTYKRISPISLMATIDENGTLIEWCKDTENVTIPSEIKTIKNGAFKGNTTIKNVVIGDGVTSIGEEAFAGCTSLTSIVIPDSVTSIGYAALQGCSSLKNLTIPFVGKSSSAASASSATLFGYIFGTSSYTGSTVAKQYYSYDKYETYYIPTSLKSVTVISGNVLYGAFYGCSVLTSVTLCRDVKSVGTYAFEGCKNLTIYCETEAEPSNWDYAWNSLNRPVVWGYTGE